jgi:indolepyruvate ferredoxin oxidoreductase
VSTKLSRDPNPVSLQDKYTLESGAVLMTGTQALVRLPLAQRRRDALAGLKTAGFISGYRGSPLGGYDRELWQAQELLQEHNIVFRPGVNEDLAATSVWGTQQLGNFPNDYDGVFSIWYGKGPGVERSGDALKHGNYSGAASRGGVLVAFGDDHAAKSSTIAHQSEQTLAAHSIPVFFPATVGEILEYGLAGWALSRFSGLWVGLKCVNETLETAATVLVSTDRPALALPELDVDQETDVNHRPGFDPVRDDMAVTRHRLPRARQFTRHNRLDHAIFGARAARLGILTAGKAYADVRYALQLLEIDDRRAQALRLDVYKVGMIWPLEESGLREFAAELEELLVVEEKRPFLEHQAAVALYGARSRPRILGKVDESGKPLLPADLPLSPSEVAIAIARRLRGLGLADPALQSRLLLLERRLQVQGIRGSDGVPILDQLRRGAVRTPYFCSGCPHNTSTRVPEGSKAIAGIGCHTMALGMGRETLPPTHMGGEGANWIGIEPFVGTKHVFQNLGDGTYYHSGLLAIRAAVAARSNISYKILFNSVVAMTGGQPIDGPISVPAVARQVLAEGVERCVLVSATPQNWRRNAALPKQVAVYSRDELDRIQRELREIRGVTVIIYEQACAAEKRRGIKRGRLPPPVRRVFINERVCEGCGDCSTKSNCVSIRPVEASLGRKRTIDQSSCNTDLSCAKGFCPSFVIVEGAPSRRPAWRAENTPELPPAPRPIPLKLVRPYNVMITGIGGTGVITVGAVLAMAAHLEGKGAAAYNMTGLAQKGGPVYGHLRFAHSPDALIAGRLDLGDADLIIACDLLAALAPEARQTIDQGRTRAVANSGIEPSATFQLFRDSELPGAQEIERYAALIGSGLFAAVDATALAKELTGDTVAANMLMIGYVCQLGLLPLSLDSILRAIELNGVAIDLNRRALELGRRAAAAGALSLHAQGGEPPAVLAQRPGLDAVVEDRRKRLVAYQDGRYARRYERRVAAIRDIEHERTPTLDGLALAVAESYARLLMYKDEYEVARLYAGIREELARSFEMPKRIKILLAPPALAGVGPQAIEPRKRAFGPWILLLFHLLSRMKGLRGTRFDPFGRTEERRMERHLIAEYESLLDELALTLTPENHSLAIQLVSLPEHIRGFGHVKMRAAAQVRQTRDTLLLQYRTYVHTRSVG